MKKPQIHLTEGAILRRKAEEQLKKRQSTVSSQSSEADIWKLTHELQVHQIELELQIESKRGKFAWNGTSAFEVLDSISISKLIY